MLKSLAIKNLQNNTKDSWSIIISIFVSIIIIGFFLLQSHEFTHWFIIPVFLSGIIITIDAIDWVRNKIPIFDPVGFIGIFGFHYFFLAPLLQINWDFGMSYVAPPEDWRPWLGGMAFINLLGLIIYRITRNIYKKKSSPNLKTTYWKLDEKKFLNISIPILFIMLLLQTYIYISMGGIDGYIRSYTERSDSFDGMGWMFMISESFPILGIMALALVLRKSKNKKGIVLIALLILIFFITRMYFGGLRGSRSNTIWALIWAVGIIHLWIRPISKKFIYGGLILLFAFIYIYGIYKGAGEEVLEALTNREKRVEITESSGRGIEEVLLGDLARTNVQAFILYRLKEHPERYDLAYGRSYLGDVSILIPKRIWPDRPPTKVKEGTEIIRGKDTFNPAIYVSSRIYGLTGEFMLNFGYIFTPLIFSIFGLFVGRVRALLYELEDKDARLLLYPFLVVCCFLLLVQDLDNLIFSITKNFMIPFILIFMCTKVIKKSKLGKLVQI